MKSTMAAFATALGSILAGASLAAPAASAQAAGQQVGAAIAQENPNALRTHQPKISRQAQKAIFALEAAMNQINSEEIPAALAAAQAVANSNDDRYAIAIIQLKAAANAKDNAGIASALEAMLASGSVTEDEKFSLYFNLANTYDGLKQPARAAHYYELALNQNPASVDATAGLAESKVAQGRTAEGLAMLKKGIELQAASGRPSENWLKRALSIAYEARMPEAIGLGRQWVKAYPTSEAWQNSLAIYHNLRELDDDSTLDLLRLKRATNVLSANDYLRYADIAVRRGNAGEAKAVLEQGFAANAIDRSDPDFDQLHKLASDRTKGDRESLPASPLANANARQTLNVGNAYFGYGDHAKAAEFFRAALSRPGADPDLINLRIGMALAHQGDKAGATAALNAVGPAHSDLAQFWLVYLNSNA